MKKSRFLGDIFIFPIIIIMVASAFVVADNSTSNSSNYSIFSSPSGSSSPVVNNLGTTSDQSAAISKGYQCLQSQINNRTASTLSLQEAVFGTLAIGSNSILQQKITNSQDSAQSCWPSGACTVKDSAQVMLAYQRSGQSYSNIQNWLLKQNGTSNDLDWYLEVDITNANSSRCTLTYDSGQHVFNVQSDMTLSGNPGGCFTFSQNGYWLLFNPSCYQKQIQISCDEDFVSTLLYQKKAGTTIFVLPDTQSAAALGTTSEQVNVQCFKSGSSCNYEGSLWATLALQKAGVSVSPFIPYLLAMSDNYQQYFPSAFLYALIGADDQYSDIVQNQQQSRFWKMIGSPYNQYYDTSLAMLALSKSSANELTNAQNYLLNIQGQDGCWNNDNIRDTAFLLYSGWTRSTGSGGSGGGTSQLCGAITGQSCTSSISCLNAGGQVLSNYACSGFNACCSITPQQQSCAAQNGAICASNQQCSGNSVPSSDSGTCCLGSCINKPLEDTCTAAGGTCRSTCNSDEQADSSQICSDSTETCCVASTQPSGGTNWTWIIILMILILLVVLAILFRNQLKVWWFKTRGKAKVAPVVRPGVPPSQGYAPRPIFRPMPLTGYRRPQMPPSSRPAPKKPASEKDKELEETLRKLREMSK